MWNVAEINRHLFAIRAQRDYVLEEDFMKAARKIADAKKLESKSPGGGFVYLIGVSCPVGVEGLTSSLIMTNSRTLFVLVVSIGGEQAN